MKQGYRDILGYKIFFVECIQTAADLTERMDTNADPCQDFYQFACGGYVEKV